MEIGKQTDLQAGQGGRQPGDRHNAVGALDRVALVEEAVGGAAGGRADTGRDKCLQDGAPADPHRLI